MARAERQFSEAERLCLKAIELRHNHPQLYLNLADVYQSAEQPQEAIEVLEKGLTSTGRHYRIRHTLKRLGRRRKPVLAFLDRSNPMNRVLGKLRHRLMGPVQAA
jgi:Flp pilus assembly protein TadD